MKRLVWLVAPLALCACSSMPTVHNTYTGTSFTLSPTSSSDARLRHPQFYRDETDSTSWLHDAPRNNQ